MAALEPDDIPDNVARMAFRMSLRLDGEPAVEMYRRILAACAPLLPGSAACTDCPTRGTTR